MKALFIKYWLESQHDVGSDESAITVTRNMDISVLGVFCIILSSYYNQTIYDEW